jgi:predicted nicotinamide N-methyase|eukprot:Stramenopile-MAST_4_protein_3593
MAAVVEEEAAAATAVGGFQGLLADIKKREEEDSSESVDWDDEGSVDLKDWGDLQQFVDMNQSDLQKALLAEKKEELDRQEALRLKKEAAMNDHQIAGDTSGEEVVQKRPQLLSHSYQFHDENTDTERSLDFEGISMNNMVDLTKFEKATGEALWPCCALLVQYLQDEWKPAEEGEVVLELGCGLGVCGAICAVRIGCNDNGLVVVTDGDTAVVDRAIANANRNFSSTDCRIIHRVLWWGDEPEMARLLDDANARLIQQSGAHVSRQTPRRFSLILASDVIYERDTAVEKSRQLAATVDRLLSLDHPNAQCIISFQQRSVDVSVLYEAFSEKGFSPSIPYGGEPFEDIYFERHERRTMFTDKFLISFRRKIEVAYISPFEAPPGALLAWEDSAFRRKASDVLIEDVYLVDEDMEIRLINEGIDTLDRLEAKFIECANGNESCIVDAGALDRFCTFLNALHPQASHQYAHRLTYVVSHVQNRRRDLLVKEEEGL